MPADADQVHRALARRRHPIGGELRANLQHRIGDALRRLGIAGAHRGWRPRREKTAFGQFQLDAAKGAGIHRDFRVGEDLHREEHGRIGHRRDGVDVARTLRRGAGEIHDQPVGRDGDREIDPHGLVAAAIVVEKILAAVGAGRQLGEAGAHAPLGIIEDRREAGGDEIGAVTGGQLAEPLFADPQRGELGVEIAAPLHWGAHVGEDHAQHILL